MTDEKKQTFKSIENLINVGRMDERTDGQMVGFARRGEESRMTPRITHIN